MSSIPVYEYRCPLCQAVYSETRGIIEEEVIKQCENCKIDYTRVFNGPVVTFKGSGFYATDKKG